MMGQTSVHCCVCHYRRSCYTDVLGCQLDRFRYSWGGTAHVSRSRLSSCRVHDHQALRRHGVTVCPQL